MTTTSASDHYDRLLAAHYSWMAGGDIAAVADGQERLLSQLGIQTTAVDAIAVDLGCGPGSQSIALARLGFASVIAVDTSRPLLDELTELADRTGHGAAVRPVHADLRTALAEQTEPSSVTTIVCMGDTLTHLPGKDDVTALLHDVARSLTVDGQLVLTYRDLTRPLEGTDRFLPVRADADRIMTCFLEYLDDDTVVVHDLIHVRTGDTWTQQISSYPKLRIAPDWLAARCREAGLQVRHSGPGPRGLQVIVMRRSRVGSRHKND